MKDVLNKSARNACLVAGVMCVLAPAAFSHERQASQPDEIPHVLQNPELLVMDANRVIADHPYFQREGLVVSQEPETQRYVLWYDDVNGNRQVSAFDLPNQVKARVHVNVWRRPDNLFEYDYRVHILEDSPQPVVAWMGQAPELGFFQGTTATGFSFFGQNDKHASETRGKPSSATMPNFIFAQIKNPLDVLSPGKTFSFSLVSELEPVISKLYLEGKPKRSLRAPGFPYQGQFAFHFRQKSSSVWTLLPGQRKYAGREQDFNELKDAIREADWLNEAELAELEARWQSLKDDALSPESFRSWVLETHREHAPEVVWLMYRLTGIYFLNQPTPPPLEEPLIEFRKRDTDSNVPQSASPETTADAELAENEDRLAIQVLSWFLICAGALLMLIAIRNLFYDRRNNG